MQVAQSAGNSRMSSGGNRGPGAPHRPVRSPYTWDQVVAHLGAVYAEKRSLRRIAHEDYGGGVSHAVIQRCLRGEEPQSSRIRLALGLWALVDALAKVEEQYTAPF